MSQTIQVAGCRFSRKSRRTARRWMRT
jgi:hypothetical protein